MKRLTYVLLLGTFFACDGRKDIATDPDALSAQLGVDVEAGCTRLCTANQECADLNAEIIFSDCSCNANGCDCGSTDACQAACLSDIAQFAAQSDACGEYIARQLDCFRVTPCAALQAIEVGASPPESVPECRGVSELDPNVCQPLDQATLPTAPACAGGTSFSGTGTLPDGSRQCELQAQACDGHDLAVRCTETPAGAGTYTCQCVVDGTIGTSVEQVSGCEGLAGDPDDATLLATVWCDWPVQASTTPVTCQMSSGSGAAGGAATLDCSLSAAGCTDGNEYSIYCAEAEGGFDCTCTVSGAAPTQVAPTQFIPSGSACPLLGDISADNLTRMNVLCGFNLSY